MSQGKCFLMLVCLQLLPDLLHYSLLNIVRRTRRPKDIAKNRLNGSCALSFLCLTCEARVNWTPIAVFRDIKPCAKEQLNLPVYNTVYLKITKKSYKKARHFPLVWSAIFLEIQRKTPKQSAPSLGIAL